MSMYAVRVFNNGNQKYGETGSMGEYEMADANSDIAPPEKSFDQSTIQLRLIESVGLNLASIAESLEGIRRELHIANQYRTGDY